MCIRDSFSPSLITCHPFPTSWLTSTLPMSFPAYNLPYRQVHSSRRSKWLVNKNEKKNVLCQITSYDGQLLNCEWFHLSILPSWCFTQQFASCWNDSVRFPFCPAPPLIFWFSYSCFPFPPSHNFQLSEPFLSQFLSCSVSRAAAAGTYSFFTRILQFSKCFIQFSGGDEMK